MKRLVLLLLFASFNLFASDLASQLVNQLDSQKASIDMSKETLVAMNCIKPIKPIMPIKPISCSGTWTLILECDQNCNCEWRPICLQ